MAHKKNMSPSYHLDELALIEHFDVLLMVVVAHVFDQLFHADIVGIDQTEGRDIYKVVLKVFHVEGLDVEGGEKIVVLVFVHLQLENLEFKNKTCICKESGKVIYAML
jgi:hypothetical protein